MKNQSTIDNEALRVRPLEPRDLADALTIFPGALMRLHSTPMAAIARPSFLEEVFSGKQCAWVAETEDRLIGMAVLSVDSQMLARLTYLHVSGDGADHAPAARALAEVAIRNAWDAGYLKLAVHTQIPADHVIEYMHELGFEYGRTQWSGSEFVVEFYRNLYERPRDSSREAGTIQ